MNYSSEPADQVVRYSLEGAEFALRISGTAAKNFFIFAQAVLHDSKKTHGKTHLIRLLKEQKPLKFFTVDKDRMHDFARAAKAHGLLFCPIRDKMDPDHIEIAILQDDASKANRIIDKLQLAIVDTGTAELIDTVQQERGETAPETERVQTEDGAVDFEVGADEEKFNMGFPQGSENASPSEPFSDSSKSFANSPSPRADQLRAKGERPSVRMELSDITAYLRRKVEPPKDRIVSNLNAALSTWNDKLGEIWSLLTESPQTFKGGQVWGVMTGIHGALQAIGYGLLVLFFAVGVMKTCGSFVEVKKPEHALKLFIRFALAKGAVTYGLELMLAVFSIVQGMVSTIITQSGSSGMSSVTLPQELIDAINNVGFWDSIPLWAVTLIGGLLITVLSFTMILTVYGRMFSLWMYAAIAPIPLSTFAGEPTSSVGKNFIRSYAGVCLQGVVIALSCIIFSAISSSPPAVDTGASVVTAVWTYVGELAFNLLVLVGAIKGCDRIVKEIMGL